LKDFKVQFYVHWLVFSMKNEESKDLSRKENIKIPFDLKVAKF